MKAGITMKNERPQTNWNAIQSKVDHVLGEDFWQDIAEMIPILGPRIDVYEGRREITVYVELAGLAQTKDIQVSLNGSVLKVSGEIHAPYVVDEKRTIVAERFYGPFSRKISLPHYTYAHVRAHFQHGLLTIVLTKTSEAEEKTIDIEHPS